LSPAFDANVSLLWERFEDVSDDLFVGPPELFSFAGEGDIVLDQRRIEEHQTVSAGVTCRLGDVIDDILVVQEPDSGEPFILAVEVRADHELLGVARGTLDRRRGKAACDACFIKQVALQSRLTREIIG